MKFSKITGKGDRITFTIKDSSTAFANALRQTVIEEIPSIAISEVDMYENISCLPDEFIAHRIGMIPLTTDINAKSLAKINYDQTVTLSLNAIGPKTVYSKELISKDKKIKSVHDNIPIIKLKDGEKIKLEAKATYGTAKQHARWQAGLAAYKMKGKNKSEFDFVIESFNNLKGKETLQLAMTVLKNKVGEVKQKFDKKK